MAGLDPLFKDPKGRAYLVQVVAFGLQGPLKVGSFTYNGLMPSMGQLKDEEIALLLNHIGASFGNRNPQPFTPAEVQRAREKRLTPQSAQGQAYPVGQLQRGRGLGRRGGVFWGQR
ncbi:hypothetical protein [Thermus sp. 2.9]|uniref:hypothetical protein n=1 Tax=Thermus sp. (strain 2.9) TaxID=1577051 RepID=UPI00350ED3DC